MATENTINVRHTRFGMIGQPSASGETFNALEWAAIPGNLDSLRTYYEKRADKFRSERYPYGICHRLTGRLRKSRLADAAEMGIGKFLLRDYAKAGIRADEVAKAVFQAATWCDRANWTESRGRRGKESYPYRGTMAGGGDDPRAVAIAEEAILEPIQGRETVAAGKAAFFTDGGQSVADGIREALVGAGGEEKIPEQFHVDGGKCCPRNDGRIGRDENGRWVQPVGYGKSVTYPACTVTDSRETDSMPRYAGSAPAPAPSPWTAEDHATIINRRSAPLPLPPSPRQFQPTTTSAADDAREYAAYVERHRAFMTGHYGD